jgi:hypothetical protein
MTAHAPTGANRLNATLTPLHIDPNPTPVLHCINPSVFRMWQKWEPGHHSEQDVAFSRRCGIGITIAGIA